MRMFEPRIDYRLPFYCLCAASLILIALSIYGLFRVAGAYEIRLQEYKKITENKGVMIWVNNDEIERQVKSDGSVYLILKNGTTPLR